MVTEMVKVVMYDSIHRVACTFDDCHYDASLMLIRCPSCQTKYTLQLTTAGALCTCFRCNHEFYVDVHGAVSAPPSKVKEEPEVEAPPPPASEPDKPERKVSLDEKIKSIDAKYKSFEDDLSWNDDNLLTIDDLGDDDIPDVEVPSSTPSLEEHLKDSSASNPKPVVNNNPSVSSITSESTASATTQPKKNRLLAWRRAKRGTKKNSSPAPEAIKKVKKRWSLPWKKSTKAKKPPIVKPIEPVIAAPKKKKHRIWPWIVLILLLLMAAGVWFKKDTLIHQPAVRSALLKVGLSKTASDVDWFIDHQSIQMRWQKNSEGKQVLIIEGMIDNALAIPLPLPQFEASFDNPKKTPLLLPSILPMHLNEAIAQHGNENPSAWLDQTPVAAHGSRLFILVLRDISPEGIHRVRVRALAGESNP